MEAELAARLGLPFSIRSDPDLALADALDLPVPLDRVAYRNAVAHLESRGLIEKGRLTAYGKAVEALR